MKWLELSKEDAKTSLEVYMRTEEHSCDKSYEELRQDLLRLFENALDEIGIKEDGLDQDNNKYQLDLRFGLQLYELLNNKYGMCVRLAATDGIWRYLAVCVVPELTVKRYCRDGKEHPDRFWKKGRRIWLRVLWWYIYLSWQGSTDATFQALKDNSTDEILQMVDRCGRGGYRTALYREIIRQYSEMDSAERRNKKMFRKMFVLNTARVQAVEPELIPGGNTIYVKQLIEYFN